MQTASFLIIILSSSVIIGILLFFAIRSSISLWFHSLVTGAKVRLWDIIRLYWEKVKPEDIANMVQAIIMASKAGVRIGLKELNAHRHSGGNFIKVTRALISAKKAGLPLTFELAKSIDIAKLAKLDIEEAVHLAIRPVVYDTPEIIGKAKDGIELKVFCRVTLCANINNIVGGADQRAILARLGQEIVGVIGSAENHQDIIANPYKIADYIMNLNKDNDGVPDIHQNTAFFVLSIDVSDINLGENIAANLQVQKAEEEAANARAEAEKRKADAVREEEKMKSRIVEMKSKLIEAEAEIPKALAEAIKKGQF